MTGLHLADRLGHNGTAGTIAHSGRIETLKGSAYGSLYGRPVTLKLKP